jgi:curved DNA-binding protein CbpA
MTSPFAALGLPDDTGLADDDVRAAWRRVAAATHPDRDDGGDPAAFAAAAGAYALLRTAAGRRDALASRADPDGAAAGRSAAGLAARLAAGLRRRGRQPVRLVIRVTAAAGSSAAAVLGAGWQPASAAVLTGALTWLVLTGRSDLTGRPR